MTTILSQVDSPMEESSAQRRGSRAYQIFPEASMNDETDSYPEDFLYRRERLPSIVVEPTEQSAMSNNVQDEENCSADLTEGSVDGEQQEDMGMDKRLVARKSSIGLSRSQLSLSHLTPPASPTPAETAPPCLKS